ncbi:MAG: type II toxin-antitoxin system VapC family toxin [Sciscionella sp.]
MVIDAVADSGQRGGAVRSALANQPAAERLVAPGHFAFEILSGLRAAANRPGHPLAQADVAQALADAEAFEIGIEATPWSDVRRAWTLAEGSLRFADAIYVAAAERQHTGLLTADARIERSGAAITCPITTLSPTGPTRTP